MNVNLNTATLEQVFGPTTPEVPVKPRNELGQEDFLRLMVAQLKNQDPSNPLDNAEFLSQIAQFTMVTGIDELGDSFQGVSDNLYASQSMQAAQLIDREVLTDLPFANLKPQVLMDGVLEREPIEGVIEFDDAVTNARFLIRNANGELINSVNLGAVNEGDQRFLWDGITKDGTDAPAGDYVISAEGLVNGELAEFVVRTYSKVESVSVDRETARIQLHLSNGERVGFNQVSEFK